MDKRWMQECEQAHYDMLQGMYFDGQKRAGDSIVVYSDKIKDNVWNYGTRVNAINNPQNTIQKVSDFLEAKKRKPAVYLTPACEPSNLDSILESQGFVNKFTDAWMFFEGELKISIPSGIQIKAVTNLSKMRVFKEVYDSSYSSGDGPYSFPQECGVAVLNSFQHQMEGVTAMHYLAFDNKTPVGILGSLSKGNLFGVYNVGTLPSMQGKGVSSTLTLFAVKKVLGRGASEIFLQTEEGSSNGSFYRNRGFHTKFSDKCYAKE